MIGQSNYFGFEICENMAQPRELEPWSPAFMTHVITAIPQEKLWTEAAGEIAWLFTNFVSLRLQGHLLNTQSLISLIGWTIKAI